MAITNAVIGFLNLHFWPLWWLVVIVTTLRHFIVANTTLAAMKRMGK